MSGFAQALHSYRDGSLSREQLLAQVELELTTGMADTATLLAVLNDEQAKGRLPGNVHLEVVRKLLRWREVPAAPKAVAKPVEIKPPDQRLPDGANAANADDAATIFIDHARGGVPREPAPLETTQRHKRPISVGSVLQGRFRLTEPSGEGGMSRVFKAIDLRKVEAGASDPHVAVKLLTVPLSDFTHSLTLLQSEAQKLQSLPHPNIVRVIDCDRDGSTVFMTMEYLPGESLKHKLASSGKGIPTPEAIRIIGGIAEALAFAHRNGIVHGDLKPGNVLITDQGEVKVIDFGIARLMARPHDPSPGTAMSAEQLQLSALTPPYASPEMLENGEPDPRDDIYALACIAHEMLTGRHPFDRTAANVARDTGMRLTRQRPVSRTQFRAIAHGLEFDRPRRTATAEQFVAEFAAKRGPRGESIAIVGGIVLAALLIAAYFLDHGRVTRWLEAHRGVTMVAPVQGELFRDCPTCPLMKALPAGRLNQGAAADQPDAAPFEKPRHAVTIAYPFGVGVYEVTVGEFKEFVEATNRKAAGCTTYDGTWQASSDLNWGNIGFPQTATFPVACVSWRDARDYAGWLSRKTGQRYRLASDSEWEYAARGGTEAPRPWTRAEAGCVSANIADEAAAAHFPGWKTLPCSDGYVYSAPVGSFQPNAFGLYDLLGNVSEWVQDCWHPDYRNAPGDGSAWMDGDCTQHDTRGGSWFTTPSLVSVTARSRFEETYRSTSVGFRLVREIQP